MAVVPTARIHSSVAASCSCLSRPRDSPPPAHQSTTGLIELPDRNEHACGPTKGHRCCVHKSCSCIRNTTPADNQLVDALDLRKKCSSQAILSSIEPCKDFGRHSHEPVTNYSDAVKNLRSEGVRLRSSMRCLDASHRETKAVLQLLAQTRRMNEAVKAECNRVLTDLAELENQEVDENQLEQTAARHFPEMTSKLSWTSKLRVIKKAETYATNVLGSLEAFVQLVQRKKRALMMEKNKHDKAEGNLVKSAHLLKGIAQNTAASETEEKRKRKIRSLNAGTKESCSVRATPVEAAGHKVILNVLDSAGCIGLGGGRGRTLAQRVTFNSGSTNSRTQPLQGASTERRQTDNFIDLTDNWDLDSWFP